MITTPEQMREAARDNDLIRRGEAFEAAEVCTCGDCYTDTYRAIRAIPIAPQPVAVTVNHIGARGERARISVPAAMCGAPHVGSYDYVALSALSPPPADPLSDPRVKALVEAADTLLRELRTNAYATDHMPEGSRVAMSAALRAIGGEA